MQCYIDNSYHTKIKQMSTTKCNKFEFFGHSYFTKMSCTISYGNNNRCKIILPFNGTQDQFRLFITKRLGLKNEDKFHIVSTNDNQTKINCCKQLKSNIEYTIIYINREVRKIQRISRAKKLNKMRRKSSSFEVLPFSRQSVAFKSKKSWSNLLRKSSKCITSLKK